AFMTGPALIVVLLVGTMVRLPTLQIITLVLTETKGVGAARIGGAAGLFFTVAEVGGFSGPLMLGIIRDATGSLEAGVLVLAIATGVLMTSTLLIREPR
ncbi:MAG: MFS transporter, partial [Dehalococcoidia bacterium]